MKKLTEKSARRLTGILIIAAVLLFAAAAGIYFYYTGVYEGYEVTTYSMGSYVQQTLYGNGKEDAAREAANNIAELEDTISWRKEGSDIQRLNAEAGGAFIDVEAVTYSLLELTQDVAEISGGAFDVTIAPLSRLWDFDGGKQTVPEATLIEKLIPNVDYSRVLLSDEQAALKLKNTAVDLGAVGKGAACDVAVRTYEQLGIDRGIIAVGGSVGIYGDKPGGSAWKVAVRDPESSASLGELALNGGSFISTSGSYEKCFEKDGVLYHHLLNPKTGYPADSSLLSVTVVASSGALSDALSTACFVTDMDRAVLLLSEYSGQNAGAVFVTKDSEVYVTSGLFEAFTLYDDSYEVKSIG